MSWITSQLGMLVDALANVEPAWVLLALALQLGNLVLRSVAWRNVLAAAFPSAPPSVTSVGRAYAIGVGLNGWLPARSGDAAKVAIVRAQHPSTNAVTIAASCTVLVAFNSFVGLTLMGGAGLSGAVPLPSPGTLVDKVFASAPLVAAIAIVLVVGLLVAARILGPRLRSGWQHARQGVAVLSTPGRWARTVLSAQALAWTCRIGVVFCMLCAFSIPATLPLAALVVVVGGMSTLIPIPGGAGSQQALAAFALAGVAPASQAIAFSLGMQLGVTAVNTTIAIIAAMLAFGHVHPGRAIKAAIAAATPAPEPIPDAVG